MCFQATLFNDNIVWLLAEISIGKVLLLVRVLVLKPRFNLRKKKLWFIIMDIKSILIIEKLITIDYSQQNLLSIIDIIG